MNKRQAYTEFEIDSRIILLHSTLLGLNLKNFIFS